MARVNAILAGMDEEDFDYGPIPDLESDPDSDSDDEDGMPDLIGLQGRMPMAI